jgi:hypothetical protein
MSIHDLIDIAKEQARLYEVEPERASWSVIRRIVATPEVYKLVTLDWKGDEWMQWADKLGEWNDRCGSLVNEFERFLNGKLVTVALDPKTEDEDCTFKRLHPSEDEVWEFRSRAPSPGIRVFGGFAATNLFVATNWELRKPLGPYGSKEWAATIKKSRVAWQEHLGSSLRKSGQLHDYISRQAVSVDPSP